MSKKSIYLIDKFIESEYSDSKLAGEIEYELDSCYPEDEFLQDAVEKLARFNPFGGDFLYDREYTERMIQAVKSYIIKKDYK